MNSERPLVSILMIVRDRVELVGRSLDSLIAQTYRPIEIVVVDGGSTDGTWEILQAYGQRHGWLHLHQLPGATIEEARNKSLELASGEFLAIADSDDLFHVDKLERQVAFLVRHPDYGVCASWVVMYGGSNTRVIRCATSDEAIRAELLFRSPLAHSSVLLRAAVLRQNGIRYRMDIAEDYDLWTRLSAVTRIGALPEVLVYYREHKGQVSGHAMRDGRMLARTRGIQKEVLEKAGVPFTERELDVHQSICGLAPILLRPSFPEANAWLFKLRDFNREARVWNEGAFLLTLSHYAFRAWRQAGAVSNARRYLQSPLSHGGRYALGHSLEVLRHLAQDRLSSGSILRL